MESYDAIAITESVPADPAAEWSSPTSETGLEEPMWILGLGGGTGSYPEKPEEPDCIYYLKTGFCGYGARCRFNHPRDRNSAMGALRERGLDYPERVNQPVCQYYRRTGMCKFGASCKYHHPRNGDGSPNSATISLYGYPQRPGESECSYYMKTGLCKFGVTCKFHHPPLAGMKIQMPDLGHFSAPNAVPAPLIYSTLQSPSVESPQQYGVVSGNWSVAGPSVLPGSYVPATYGAVMLPQGIFPVPGWSPYPASVTPFASPNPQTTVGEGPIYGMPHLSPSPAYTGPYLTVPISSGPSDSTKKENLYPEKPSQRECRYFLKTGVCKFGSSCRYHHPSELRAPQKTVVLSPMGLPLQLGAPVCSEYLQNGVCKFGSSCIFDHPIGTLRYSPSISSLTDVPVAPYPGGSSTAVLARSSSSPDLRPELISGSNKDSFNTRNSASWNSPNTTSVASFLPKSHAVPHSNAHHSESSSAPSTDS